MFSGFNNDAIFPTKDVDALAEQKQPYELTGEVEITTEMVNVTITSWPNEPLKNFPKIVNVTCPIERRPENIGSYEIPTQKDMLLLTKTTLENKFKHYKNKAHQFLRNINKTNHPLQKLEDKCDGLPEKIFYKHCISEVKNQWISLTTKTMERLEDKLQLTSSYIEGICYLRTMGDRPLILMHTIDTEIMSLTFAMPGYLKMISSCSSICNIVQNNGKRTFNKPSLISRRFL